MLELPPELREWRMCVILSVETISYLKYIVLYAGNQSHESVEIFSRGFSNSTCTRLLKAWKLCPIRDVDWCVWDPCLAFFSLLRYSVHHGCSGNTIHVYSTMVSVILSTSVIDARIRGWLSVDRPISDNSDTYPPCMAPLKQRMKI